MSTKSNVNRDLALGGSPAGMPGAPNANSGAASSDGKPGGFPAWKVVEWIMKLFGGMGGGGNTGQVPQVPWLRRPPARPANQYLPFQPGNLTSTMQQLPPELRTYLEMLARAQSQQRWSP